MSTALAITALVVGIVLVVAAAEALLDGLVGLGRRLGVAPFVLTVALSGFELENVAVGIAADLNGLPGAAAGTFLGGTTFLALAVAGIGALIAPMNVALPGPFAVWSAVAALPLAVLCLDNELSRIDGAILVAWFVVALVATARTGRSLLAADDEGAGRRRPLLRLAAGLAGLTGGGWLLSDGLRTVVSDLGVSQTLLGNTAIAASIEAEEVARVAVPARRGRPEIALGNIAGTIVHFVALNAGIIALVKPLTLDHASLRFHLPVAVASTALLAALLGIRRHLGRPEGALLCTAYVAYVAASIAIAV